MTCHTCGAQLSPAAKFCHKCGAVVGTGGSTGWRVGLPWGLAGAALGALVAVVLMRSGTPTTETLAGPVGIRAPDISQMSPEERANRLFNRVMILAEAGKQDSVRFFLPMALGAYGLLPTRDPDARFHIGELQLAGEDVPAALAQADTIQSAEPTHLFIYVLRARAYHKQGNRALERRAYADYLRNEAAELARNRPEYAPEAHRGALTAFHDEAVRQTGRSS